MVNEGKLGSNEKTDKFQVKSVASIASDLSTGSTISPKRTQEKTLSIWIAPYEDKSGNFHEAAVIHTVVQTGSWGKVDPKQR